VSKFELSETLFERTVRDKIACQNHLEWENDSLKQIFGILIKFPIHQPEKTLQNFVQSGRKAVSKFELPETQFQKTVQDKTACQTHLKWENDSFKHIFEILSEFPIKPPEKTSQNLVQSGRKTLSKFENFRNTVWKDSQGQNRC